MTVEPEDPMRGRVDRAIAAMGRLPVRPGVTYRAAAGASTDDLSTWTVGAVLADAGFFATSREAVLGLAFGDVVLRVTGGSGRDIGALSQFPAEAEVVYLPGTAFRVSAVHRDTSTQRVLVDLEETTELTGAGQVGGPSSIAELPELSGSDSRRWQDEVRRSSSRLGEISASTVNLAKWSDPLEMRPVGSGLSEHD